MIIHKQNIEQFDDMIYDKELISNMSKRILILEQEVRWKLQTISYQTSLIGDYERIHPLLWEKYVNLCNDYNVTLTYEDFVLQYPWYEDRYYEEP